MANLYPEGNGPKPSDDAARSLRKWNQIKYDAEGDKGPSYFPEGSKPLVTDPPERTLQKLVALYQ